LSIICPKCHSENPDTKQFCGDCGTQLTLAEKPDVSLTRTLETPVDDLPRGTLFAERYEIIEELGTGGMGKVYRVEDTKAKEEIALKLIKPEIAEDKKTIDRFRNELITARKIRHKNICGMYDLGEDKGSYYITMEYVSGEDLKSFIRRSKKLTTETAVSIGKQICEGLSEAHRLGVVHRDLKPSNIMIDKQGNARIMDFGIARSLKTKGITRAGMMIGTPEYISPEQVDGKEVDQRADIYSLGVILYEMVTGKVPFEGETALSIAHKHKYEDPEEPKSINVQIPDDLNIAMLKCLEKDRDKRYQNAEDVRSKLESIEKEIPTTAREIPKTKSLTAREITVQFSLKKIFIPVSALIVVILAAVVIWQILPKKEATAFPGDKPSLAVMYFENNTDLSDFDNILLTLLTTNLSRFEGIEVVSNQRLFDILRQIGTRDVETINKNVATEIAQRAGVKTMLLGSILKIGERIRIVANLTDVHNGAIVGSEQVEGAKEEDIFQMVDTLTASISKQLGVFPAEKSKDLKIADVTTNSYEALQYYQKGIEDEWNFNFEEAIDFFQKAIAIDNTFASAYLRLAIIAEGDFMYWALSPYKDLAGVKKNLALVKEYSHDISERERLLLKSVTSWYNHDMDSVYKHTKKFVDKYPKDRDTYYYLGQAAWAMLDFSQAKRSIEKLIELNLSGTPGFTPHGVLSIICANMKDYSCMKSASEIDIDLNSESQLPYLNGCISHAIARKFDKALSYLDYGFKKFPEYSRMWKLYYGKTLLIKGETDEARNKFPLPEDYDSGRTHIYFWRRGHSFLVEGKYKKAYLEFRKAVELAQSAQEQIIEYAIFTSTRDLGKIFAVQGKYDDAIREFTKIINTSKKATRKGFNPFAIEAKYLIGITLLKRGDYEAARNVSNELAMMIKDQNLENSHMNYYYLLMGEFYIANEDYQAVEDCLERLTGSIKISSSHYWKLRADTYALMGEWDKAIEAYSNLYSNLYLTAWGWGNDFDFYRERSRVDYNLAKIYEKKKEPLKAIEHYQKFLDLMKDADPGIAEVKDARERLAELKLN